MTLRPEHLLRDGARTFVQICLALRHGSCRGMRTPTSRKTTSLWGEPKVNMSRREAASMYATFLCASSCSYFFISPAPQLSSCCVLSSSFSSPLTILTLVWSVLLVFPARVETVQCNVLRDGDSQSCMAATGAVAVHQRSTTLRLQHTGALAQRLTR